MKRLSVETYQNNVDQRKRIHSTYDISQSNANKITSAFMGVRYIRNLIHKKEIKQKRTKSYYKDDYNQDFNDIIYQKIDCKQRTEDRVTDNQSLLTDKQTLNTKSVQTKNRQKSQHHQVAPFEQEMLQVQNDLIYQEQPKTQLYVQDHNKALNQFLDSQTNNNKKQFSSKINKFQKFISKVEIQSFNQVKKKKTSVKKRESIDYEYQQRKSFNNLYSQRQRINYENVKGNKKLKVTKITQNQKIDFYSKFQKEFDEIELHQNTDLIQVDPRQNINKNQTQNQATNYQLFDVIQSKYQPFLNTKQEKILQIENCEKIRPYVLDQNQIEFLKQQSILPKLRRNTKQIIDLLKKTKFFVKLFPLNSLEIIKNSEIKFYHKGDQVFDYGDVGSSIFIILTGTVETIKTSILDSQEIQHDQLFEGMTFGESDAALNEKSALNRLYQTRKLNNIRFQELVDLHQRVYDNDQISQSIKYNLDQMDFYKAKCLNDFEDAESKRLYDEYEKRVEDIKEQQRLIRYTRSYKALASSKAILLNVDQKIYQKNMNTNTNENIDKQIQVLKLIPIFRNLDPTDLIIIASVMKKEYFGCNQIVVREGEHPNKLYIVMDGLFQISKEQLLSRKDRRPQEKDLQKIKTHKETINTYNDIEEYAYQFQQVDEQNGLHTYKQIINFGQLNKGSFFMTRALKAKLSQDNSYFDYKSVKKSKVSIISIYGPGHLLSIQCEQLLFLPSYLKELFMKLANESNEVDDIQQDDKIQKLYNLDRLRNTTIKQEFLQKQKENQIYKQ